MSKRETNIDGVLKKAFFGRCRLWLLVLLALCGAAAQAQTAPVVAEPKRLDDTTTFCQGVRVAALGPERVIVGWTAADGDTSAGTGGIYFRQRLNLLWETARPVAGPGGDQPRDLDLTFDERGRVHLVWTALAGGRRAVFHARLDAPTAAIQAAEVKVPHQDGKADADFPSIQPEPGGGVVIVWQECQAMRYMIRAARVDDAGTVIGLGLVSGDSLSGIAPQILSTRPALCVAWTEISEVGSELRVDQWWPDQGRWRPAAAERLARAFPRDAQVLLEPLDAGKGMAACWQGALEGGQSAIELGVCLPKDAAAAMAPPIVQPLADPPGEHSRPRLSGELPGRLTLSWQVFAEGRQQIRLASTTDAGQAPRMVTVSSLAQRFAASPDHVTVGRWSAVAWTDDVHDGGTGGVYFTEVLWPTL